MPAHFYRRAVLDVARDLLGLILETRIDGSRTAGRIVEVEAYRGPSDQAAHSAGGRRTPRNEVMFGPGGRVYVYLIYGLHHCMNVVVGDRDVPEAVLLRGLEPIDGIPTMQRRRGMHLSTSHLARGPGNLTRALGVTREQNGASLARGAVRLLRPSARHAIRISRRDLVRSPRIGIDYAGAWAAKPWRFSLRGNASVSRPPRGDRAPTRDR